MYYMAGVVDEGTVMLGGGGVAGSSCLEAAACCSFQALCDAGDPKPSSDLVEQSKQPRAKDEALSDTETVARQAASGCLSVSVSDEEPVSVQQTAQQNAPTLGQHSTSSSQANAEVYRLKVVGIPEGYSEDQLKGLFSLCGQVQESRVVHDKNSGRAVGYGYVSYASKEAADLAISTFDDQLQLQGAASSLSVYYAKKQNDNTVTQEKESCPARNAKLYFCGTPSSFRRDSILALFSAFGRVRHLQVYTDSFGVLASGTVTMYSTEEATAAMNSLDGKVLQPGTAPLKVTWAQLSTVPRRTPAGGGPPPPMPKGFTVSYACLPTFVTPSEVAAMFERYGMVLQVVPFAHRREGPANSRGCGLVVMESEPAAMEAREALSGKFTWPGAERPLLVQPFYGVERVGPHQLPTLFEGPGSNAGSCGNGNSNSSQVHGGSSCGGGRTWQPGGNHHHLQGGQGGYGYGDDRGRRGAPAPAPAPPAAAADAIDNEPRPPSCAPDAFKLVLTNLPNGYSQSDISALLHPYGSVVSVFREQSRDPHGDSTVSVWFQTGSQAEAALAALRNVILMAPGGPRKLVIKTARYRGPTSQQQGMRHHHQQQQQQQQHHAMAGQYSGMGPGPGSQGSGGSVLDSPGHGPCGTQAAVFQQHQAVHTSQVMQPVQVQYGYGPPGIVQPALQVTTPGQQGMDASLVWQSAPATGQMSSAATVMMQLAGGPLGQLGGGRAGALDMQQLMYVLPQQGGAQTAAPMAAAGGMEPGELWSMAAAPQVLPEGQVPAANSGGLMEQLQSLGSDVAAAPNFMAHTRPQTGPGPGPGVSAAPPGAAFTGWLY